MSPQDVENDAAGASAGLNAALAESTNTTFAYWKVAAQTSQPNAKAERTTPALTKFFMIFLLGSTGASSISTGGDPRDFRRHPSRLSCSPTPSENGGTPPQEPLGFSDSEG